MPFWLRLIIALGAMLALYLVAVKLIRFMLRPAPPEPSPEDVHPVHYRYRCTVCGAEVTMTAAPGDDVPEAPRHCREDMRLLSDFED